MRTGMHRILARILLGALLVAGGGCAELGLRSVGRIAPRRYLTSGTSCQTPAERPFACVRARCEQAGGRFLEENSFCDCGSGRVFSGWGEGSCGFVTSIFDVARTATTISPARGWRSEEFEKWREKQSREKPSSLVGIPQYYPGAKVEIRVGPGTLDSISRELLRSLTKPSDIPLFNMVGAKTIRQLYYVLREDSLQGDFIVGNYDGRIQVPFQEGDLASHQRIAAMANPVLRERFIPSQSDPYSDDGCAGYCELSRNYETPRGRVTRRRAYVGGQRHSDFLFLWEEEAGGPLLALVSLLPSGQVSLIHEFSGGEHRIYDRRFHSLLSKSLPGVASVPSRGYRFGTLIDDPLPQAVLCEGAFGSGGEKQSFLWGPWSVSPLAGSPRQDTFTAVEFETHARRVARLITGEDASVHLIPVTLDFCVEQTQCFDRMLLENSNARVINFSALTNRTPAACAHYGMGRFIKAQENRFLYVVGAGNDGLDADQYPVAYCPQNLSGAPNLLVVAAGTERGLSAISNYGKTYADLAAPGRANTGHRRPATSFAAPRVTRAAAILFSRFPHLSPATVRKALMLGVEIPSDDRGALLPLRVRSGGVLNIKRALEVARFWARSPELSSREVLARVYCGGDHSCVASESRFKLFRHRGVISGSN